MRKILRQDVVTLPKQSLTGLKVALGVRAQYMMLVVLSVLMVTQVIGAAIFSGSTQASGEQLTTTRVSTTSAGEELDQSSFLPVITDDGHYMVFRSSASNVVSDDTNNTSDIFRKDLQTGSVVRVSTAADGEEANNGSQSYSITPDGRYVLFGSDASNLVAEDTNGTLDIFRKDLQTGEVVRVSTTSSDEQAEGAYNSVYNGDLHITADGRYAFFVSDATNLVPDDTNGWADVFRKDLQTGAITRESVSSSDDQGDGQSTYARVTSDGDYLVFSSDATNLVPNDTNGLTDIFRKDLQTGEVLRISTTSDGDQVEGGYGGSGYPSITPDGNYVSFSSDATNLIVGDTNDSNDMFRKNLQTGEVARVNPGAAGGSLGPNSVLTADGRYVLFLSYSPDLVPDDTNDAPDIFRIDMQTDAITRVNVATNGDQAAGYSDSPVITPDGQYVAFDSDAANLVTGDTNNANDVFLVELTAPTPPPEPEPNTPIVTITSPSDGTSFTYDQNDVTVTGTGPANQTITVYLDGQQLGTTSVNGSGNWQYVAHNVAAGSHSFSAKWIPGGDVAYISGFMSESLGGMDVRIFDTSNDSLIDVIHLPETFYGVSVSFNHAGTKAYVTGIDMIELVGGIAEIDVSTGMIDRIMYDAADSGWYGVSSLISADDHYAYRLTYSTNDDDLGIFKIITTDLVSGAVVGDPIIIDEQNFGFTPGSHWQDILYTFADLEGSGPRIFTPISEDPAEDTVTASAINTLTRAVESFDLMDAFGYVTAHTTTVSGKVYFALGSVNSETSSLDLVVKEINTTNNTIVQTYTVAIPDGLDPHGDEWPTVSVAMAMTVDEAAHRAYIVTPGYLYTLNLTNGTRTYFEFDEPLGTDFHSMQLANNGSKLYITTAYDDDHSGLLIYDTATHALQTINTGESFFVSGGDFISSVVPASATITFGIGEAPVVDPPPEPPTPDPRPPVEDPDPPTVTDVTPDPAPYTPGIATPIKAPQAVVAAQSSLFALAKRIPEPFAIGFPWILLLLALILVSIQYYQVRSEKLATEHVQASVANQERLVDEQNNFVALSTHYLHTPLTVMEGEISLMVKAGTLTQDQANKLQATLASLNAEAEAVLAQEEQNEVE